MLKFVTSLCAVLLLMGLLTDEAWATGQFTDSCEKIGLFNGSNLTANCRKLDKSIHFGAFIDLNKFIKDEEGKLVWHANGDFASSCKHINIVADKIGRLGAVCRKSNGMTVFSFINLDEHIANSDGDLVYDGNLPQ